MKKTTKVICFSALLAVAIAIPVTTSATDQPWLSSIISKEEYEKLPAEKKEDIDKEIKLMEDARSGKIPQADKNVEKEKGPEKLPDMPPFPHGISDDTEVPPTIRDFVAKNRWQGIIGTNAIIVYAGVTDDNSQGAVVVQVMNETKKRQITKIQQIPTPSQDGFVTVTKEDGSVLTLTSEKGSTFTFDLNELKFK